MLLLLLWWPAISVTKGSESPCKCDHFGSTQTRLKYLSKAQPAGGMLYVAMNRQHQRLPVETLDHIINLIPDSPDEIERRTAKFKRTLLECALVCRTWASLARRRLLSLYFPSGSVQILPYPEDIVYLVDMFQSPLCTLDPTFIKVLDVSLSPRYLGFVRSPKPKSFFQALSILDATLFPSIRTIIFNERCLRQAGYNDKDTGYVVNTPSLPVLSQIKYLDIRSPHPSGQFIDFVRAIELCPSVEQLTASTWGTTDCYDGCSPIRYFHLPASLQKLDIDAPTLVEMAEWLEVSEPNSIRISSLSLEICWNNQIQLGNYVLDFLEDIGSNLEEFRLNVVDDTFDSSFRVDHLDRPLEHFMAHTSLKRFIFHARSLDVIEILSYLFKHGHFAPQLETLEFIVPELNGHLSSLEKLAPLDQYVRSRPSINRIIISCSYREWFGEWETWCLWVESRIRQYLPWCEEKGIIVLDQRT